MRILHVLNSPKLGGTESWVLNFVSATTGDVENELVLFDDDGPLRAEMAPHLRGVVRGGVPRPLRILDLLRLCGRSDADQVWLHSDLARAYGAFLPVRRHPTCVAVCHSSWGAGTVLDRLSGAGRRRGWNGVITVSERIFDDLPADALTGRHAALVPPPRVVDRSTAGRSDGGSGRSLVYVARLVEGKGHETLLTALALLLGEGCEVDLVLVGEGPLRHHLEQTAARLGIGAAVEFAGGAADVSPYLGSADVFVHPSESEGFSISGLEAALAGLPIVARALPCHDEYLRPGTNGLVFAEPDEESLARSIRDVLADLPRFTAGAEQVRDSIERHVRTRFAQQLAEVLAWR